MKLKIEIKERYKKLPRKLMILGYSGIALFFGSILFINFIPESASFMMFSIEFLCMFAVLVHSIDVRVRKK